MAHQNLVVLCEIPCQPFHEINRAVASAGAAYSHSEIVSIVANEAGQPVIHESFDVLEHSIDADIRVKEFDYPTILSGKGPQKRFIMRIGKAANIEYHIGIQRNAVFEAKRLEQERQTRMIEPDEISYPCPQGAGAQVAGVDAVCEIVYFTQRFALQLYAFRQG